MNVVIEFIFDIYSMSILSYKSKELIDPLQNGPYKFKVHPNKKEKNNHIV